MSITRRLFLRNAAAVGAAGATIAAPSTVEAAAPLTAKERYAYHLAEFKKAAEEIDPAIGSWRVMDPNLDSEGGCSLIVTASRVTGRYQGDGLYEAGCEKPLGGYVRYQVRLLKTRIDGERSFEVRTSMDRMVLSEPRLNTFIRQKVA